MSLDKNKQQSPSHSLPLSTSPSLSSHSPCVPLHILLPRRNGFTSDANRFFPMTLSNMLICSCQRLFVRLDRICEVRCSARNACRRTGSFPVHLRWFFFFFSVIWAVGNGNSQAASCSPTLYMCIWMPFRMCLIFCDSFLTLWVHCTFFIPEPGDACEKQSLEEGRGVIKAWE